MEKNKRFTLQVDLETHTTVKMRAFYRNITIKDYILQALAEKIMREDGYNNEPRELYEH
jgi:hypothetical protein